MLKFGFKKLIEEKKEHKLFDFPHMIMSQSPEEAGRVYKFVLKDARDLLKFDLRNNKISWFYDETADKSFYLINVTSVAEQVTPLINVNIGLDFNCKPLHDKMVKILNLDPTNINCFKLEVADDIEGLPTVKLTLIGKEVNATSDTEQEEVPFNISAVGFNNVNG